jgi:hypothetical protein
MHHTILANERMPQSGSDMDRHQREQDVKQDHVNRADGPPEISRHSARQSFGDQHGVKSRVDPLREQGRRPRRRAARQRSSRPKSQRQPAEHQRDDGQSDSIVNGVKEKIGRAGSLTNHEMDAVRPHDGAAGAVLHQHETGDQPVQRNLRARIGQGASRRSRRRRRPRCWHQTTCCFWRATPSFRQSPCLAPQRCPSPIAAVPGHVDRALMVRHHHADEVRIGIARGFNFHVLHHGLHRRGESLAGGAHRALHRHALHSARLGVLCDDKAWRKAMAASAAPAHLDQSIFSRVISAAPTHRVKNSATPTSR